jgi:hypothetical protein
MQNVEEYGNYPRQLRKFPVTVPKERYVAIPAIVPTKLTLWLI